MSKQATSDHVAQKPIATAKTRRTQTERTEETRRRILDAAVDVLAAKGYAGFRTADVAEMAGVSRGAQTHHFPSKDELLVAVVEHVFKRTADLGRKRARRVGSVDEAIKILLSDSQDFFFSELFLIAMDLAIQGRLTIADGNPVGDISASSRLPVEASWLEALIESGVPEAVAEDLLWLTISIVRGLAVRRLWQNDTRRFNRLFRLWRQMVACYLEALPHLEPHP
ncbi:MAG: helix-turn-helix domain-containing protein [Rhodoferax sp.]|uniref:TetR/AcrR family transcriptional regulator n=1 Tax=Rhodoferax sp. TaxID=50421 RepID=UPI00271E831C|nr:TetR/AcrR family transcriptional regulator [Rhodoferax sp.]MDO8451197.1 helix-turn-helix domain-containing protein [Rhodoferax sp.]